MTLTQTYLTRRQVAELFPISEHKLASLASRGLGPIFFKPIDKALYRPQDIEAWIEAARVTNQPTAIGSSKASGKTPSPPKPAGRGRSAPRLPQPPVPGQHGRKSLPPSPNSWLRRIEHAAPPHASDQIV